MKITDTMVFFWGEQDVFSNWHPSRFVIGGVEYLNVEQYMMAAKARIFKDFAIEAEILAEKYPANMKALGKKVAGYSDEVWFPRREKVVFDGGFAKFTQNLNMAAVLLDTGFRHLVEASPYDSIYGVGLRDNDIRISNPKRWLGQNLLGSNLMRVRTELQIIYPPGTFPL